MDHIIRKYKYSRFCIAILVLLTSATFSLKANETDTDSIRFSLITCAPGNEEIYTLFGHTAIRYENPLLNIDAIFNYGIFSFNTPNFIWRFVKGETDYILAVNDYNDFIWGYIEEDREIRQQTLNLKPEEKQKLLNILLENSKPENRTYRYNFFFDNCATRPRDRIEECIYGEVVYQEVNQRQTFRDIVHRSSMEYPWDRFGMDFCLGMDADKPISYRQEMFHPICLMDAFNTAIIEDPHGNARPLVSDTEILYQPVEDKSGKNYIFTPLRTFILLFLLIAVVTLFGIKIKKSLWGIDIFLFTAAGLAGCILVLLNFFSEHPAVSHNFLLLVFHPFHLLFLPFFIRKEIQGKRSRYHVVNTGILTIFILLWPVIPQYFNPAILPMALCLLIRSVSNLVLTYKITK